MSELHESDQEFLDNLSQQAIKDPNVQVMLDVIAELSQALDEGRPLKENYRPMLSMLLAAHATMAVDLIRFGALVKPRRM